MNKIKKFFGFEQNNIPTMMILMTMIMIAILILILSPFNHCGYGNNSHLLKENIQKRQSKTISDSKYYKRVIVFTLILVVITTIIILVGSFFVHFKLERKDSILYAGILGFLAIIVVFVLLFVDATQYIPFVGFIFLCLYAIFLALVLYVMTKNVSPILIVIVWSICLLICTLGLFFGYKIMTDLTKTLDAYSGFFLMVFFAGIILAGIYFIRDVESEGYFIMGIAFLILLLSLTVIIGQIVFKRGYLNLRYKWPMSVLLLITLIDIMYAMTLSEYQLLRILRGELLPPRRHDDKYKT
ncbi:unnamed protein product [Trichobilharzia szidati]|nr:unnamed protein product [Trichobilharzia szidati]